MILYPNHMGLESSTASSRPQPCPGRTAARLARQVELALAEVDLTLPQYRALIHLDEGLVHKGAPPKILASALADKLAVSRPSITGVIDGLVTKGLVERHHHDPDDRRRVGLNLTAKGRTVLGKADESVNGRLSAIASTPADQADDDTTRGDAGGAGIQAFNTLEQWREALDAYREASRNAYKGGNTKSESKDTVVAK